MSTDTARMLQELEIITATLIPEVVYLNSRAKFHLENYLKERDANEDMCPFLFSTQRRPYRKMQNKTIQDEIDKIYKRTDLTKKVHPHVFRHTMATLAMENGIELGDLQQLQRCGMLR